MATVVNLKMYNYPTNYKPPDIGDIILERGLKPRRITEILPDSVITTYMSGRRSKVSFYQLNMMYVVKSANPVKNTFINIINADGVSITVFVSEVADEFIYFYSKIGNGNVLKTITVGNTQYYLYKGNKRDYFFVRPVADFIPMWYYKFNPDRIQHIKTALASSLGPYYKKALTEISEKFINRFKTGMISSNKLFFQIKEKVVNNGRIVSLEYDVIDAQKGKNNFHITFSEEDIIYIIPKLRRVIMQHDMVYYIGNKINISNIQNIRWTVMKIVKAKDNPALDQITINFDEMSYVVFRKELKLIKSSNQNENNEEKDCRIQQTPYPQNLENRLASARIQGSSAAWLDYYA